MQSYINYFSYLECFSLLSHFKHINLLLLIFVFNFSNWNCLCDKYQIISCYDTNLICVTKISLSIVQIYVIISLKHYGNESNILINYWQGFPQVTNYNIIIHNL